MIATAGTFSDPASARLILYTDGVTETPDAREDLFGLERLTALTVAERDAAPEVFADRVIGALHDFANTGAFVHDDVTLVIVDVAILDAS